MRSLALRVAASSLAVLATVSMALSPLARADGPRRRFHSLAHESFGTIDKLISGARFDPKRNAYFTRLSENREVELTLDHRLQTQLEQLLIDDEVPTGAIVVTDPRSGRVLAVAGRTDEAPANLFALKAVAPAASVFKVVTSAALIEAGIDPDRAICFHGGKSGIDEHNITDDPTLDDRCASLSEALGPSVNLVFGKLASKVLDSTVLRRMAARFFFNTPLPVFPSTAADALLSPAEIPDASDKLEFGRAAAGFGNVHMSPLHGVVLAGAIANHGMVIAPSFVAALWTDGQRDDLVPTRQERVVEETTADKLVAMMRRTVESGTAWKSFHHGRRRVMGDIMVAGKTGTLSDKDAHEDTWFVGFAPVGQPEVAISALAVNGPHPQTKAAALARDALLDYFQMEDEAADR